MMLLIQRKAQRDQRKEYQGNIGECPFKSKWLKGMSPVIYRAHYNGEINN